MNTYNQDVKLIMTHFMQHCKSSGLFKPDGYINELEIKLPDKFNMDGLKLTGELKDSWFDGFLYRLRLNFVDLNYIKVSHDEDKKVYKPSPCFIGYINSYHCRTKHYNFDGVPHGSNAIGQTHLDKQHRKKIKELASHLGVPSIIYN